MSSINNRRFIRKASKLPTLGIATKAAEPAAAARVFRVPGSMIGGHVLPSGHFSPALQGAAWPQRPELAAAALARVFSRAA